ncbi:hypothetical protein PHLGIDRAFT_439005 [Phlebiopsis gigantea 11061_1 CR5-6]|uniref:Uncharacterized protein n=1 Tax=Phlebiopsis gigantea (strain 11061_1 CR5-6) TaxID=745531 RepID=A0A0C3SFA4_PHLG1|nr:hypothetical protein PHLGIDRAFT_439005 [Phlebiopsis gigantea 11061_1 CR5-6]
MLSSAERRSRDWCVVLGRAAASLSTRASTAVIRPSSLGRPMESMKLQRLTVSEASLAEYGSPWDSESHGLYLPGCGHTRCRPHY